MTHSSMQLQTPPPEYHGRLTQLLAILTTELEHQPPGKWASRLLRGGALVSVQCDADARRTLRLARAERPLTVYGLTRWGQDVTTFLKHLGASTWQSLPEESTQGISVRFLEVFPGETRPGFTRCSCGTELPFDQLWGAPRCPRCGAPASG